jgi:hypothetical protein
VFGLNSLTLRIVVEAHVQSGERESSHMSIALVLPTQTSLK